MREVVALVADDDGDLRDIYAAALEKDGWMVVQAANGSEVLAYLEGSERPPDVIVTDHQMPGGDGLALIEAARALDLGIPILLVTSFPDVQLLDEARRCGASEVLEKPFEEGALRRAVANLFLRAAAQGDDQVQYPIPITAAPDPEPSPSPETEPEHTPSPSTPPEEEPHRRTAPEREPPGPEIIHQPDQIEEMPHTPDKTHVDLPHETPPMDPRRTVA